LTVSRTLTLTAVLDLNAAKALKSDFVERRGQPISVDASQVQRLGGLCLQVLIAARRAWAADGLTMTIAPQSSAFAQALRLFGAADRFETESFEGGMS
jgi:chemotaxis protein CheX